MELLWPMERIEATLEGVDIGCGEAPKVTSDGHGARQADGGSGKRGERKVRSIAGDAPADDDELRRGGRQGWASP